MQNGTLAAVDLGTSKVCTIIVNVSGGNIIEVMGWGVAESAGVEKGVIVDIEKAGDSVVESLEQAEKARGLRVQSVVMNTSGRHLSSFNNRATLAIHHRSHVVSKREVKKGYKASTDIDLPIDRGMLHAIPRGYHLDGLASTRNPVGLFAYKLEVESHIITAGLASVQNLVECLASIGVKVGHVVANYIASGAAMLQEGDEERVVAVVDIGAGTTDVAVYKDGRIWHSFVLTIGGDQVTRDMAAGLGISFEMAEKLKMEYGSTLDLESSKMEEVSSKVHQKYGISYEYMNYIIKARVEELLEMVHVKLADMAGEDTAALTGASVRLCGGGAHLKGLPETVREVMGIPAVVAVPKRLAGPYPSLDDISFATGIGLVLCELAEEKVMGARFLSQDGFLKRRRTRPRINLPRISIKLSRGMSRRTSRRH